MKEPVKEAMERLGATVAERERLELSRASRKRKHDAEYKVNAAGKDLLYRLNYYLFFSGEPADKATVDSVRQALAKSIPCVTVWPECKKVMVERLARLESMIESYKRRVGFLNKFGAHLPQY
jgi:hypothetical protein